MSAWSKGGAATSCDSLLTRVEQNDASLKELIILSNKSFGPAQVKRLSAAIATGRNTNLTLLSASGHALPPSSLETLGAAIAKQQSNLTRLAIGHNQMGDEGAVALCNGLSTNNNNGLQELDLEWKDLSVGAMAAIGRTFGPSQTLEELNLSRNNRIGDQGITAMCDNASNRCRELGLAYYSFPALTDLNLAECNISVVGVEALLELLGNFGGSQGRKSLALNLNGNPLGMDSCVVLASLLCDSPLLTSLSISNCNVDNMGMSILSAAVGMSLCEGVEVLDLSHNTFQADGAKSLASSISGWTRLQDLRLAGNNLSETGVEALVTAVTTRNQQLSLDLSQTNCGIQGAVAALKCKHLTSLRLFNNKLGSDGFEALAPLLKGGHESLVNLDLCGNDASEAAVTKVLLAIADTSDCNFVSTLRVLEIGGNSGGPAVEDAIVKLKLVHPELDVARDRPRGQQQSQA